MMVSDGIFEGLSTRREKIRKIFVDEFITMLLMWFVAIGGTLTEFANVVEECGEV
jgi:hypothetical protein